MEHINLANIEKFIEDHELLSNFDIYFLGFMTKFTEQEKLESVYMEISPYLDLEAEGLLTFPDKLKEFVTVLLQQVEENKLPEINQEWLDNNEGGTKEQGMIEYFNQIGNTIQECNNILKIELYYIGNFHALDPSTQIETVLTSIQKTANNRTTVTKKIEFLCKIFRNKLASSQKLNILKFPNQKERAIKVEAIKKEGNGIVFGLPKESNNTKAPPPPHIIIDAQKEQQSAIKVENNVDNNNPPLAINRQMSFSNTWFPPANQVTPIILTQQGPPQDQNKTHTEFPTQQLPNFAFYPSLQSNLLLSEIANQVSTIDHTNFNPNERDIAFSTHTLSQNNIDLKLSQSFGMNQSASSMNSDKNDFYKKPETPQFKNSQFPHFPVPGIQQNIILESESQVKIEATEVKIKEPKGNTTNSASTSASSIQKSSIMTRDDYSEAQFRDTEETLNPVQKKKKKELTDNQTKISCFVCERVIEKTNIYSVLEACQHVCCRDCSEEAIDFIHAEIQAKKLPLACPIKECKQEIQLSDLVHTLRDSDYTPEDYIKYALETYIENHDHIYCCPTAGCPYAFQKKSENHKFICPLCKKSYCLYCRIDWHENASCTYRRVKEEDTNDKQMKAKECPKCGFWVTKIQGYKCLSCCRCYFKFCYDCGAQREEGDCKCMGQTSKVPIVDTALFYEAMKTPERYQTYKRLSEFNARQEALKTQNHPADLPKITSIDIIYCHTATTKVDEDDISYDGDDISYPPDILSNYFEEEKDDDYLPPGINRIPSEIQEEDYSEDELSYKGDDVKISESFAPSTGNFGIDNENSCGDQEYSNDISYAGSDASAESL